MLDLTVNVISANRGAIFLFHLALVVVYYLDMAKDIFITVQIKNMMLGEGYWWLEELSFPANAFMGMIASIVLGELANVLALISSKEFAEFNLFKKVASVLLIPLLPTYLQFRECTEKIRMRTLIAEARSKNHDVLPARSRAAGLLSLRSLLRVNENCTEHLVQGVLLMLIILLHKTSSPNAIKMEEVLSSWTRTRH